jgi:adenosylcobinamide-phosphate synthase
VAEAAFAAALGLRLGGVNVYGAVVERRPDLGQGCAASVVDINRASRLSRDVAALLGALLTLPAAARVLRGRSRGKTPLANRFRKTGG